MIIHYFSRGFIDPRRADSVMIIFEITEDLSDDYSDPGKNAKTGSYLRSLLKKQMPDMKKFAGRESWFEISKKLTPNFDGKEGWFEIGNSDRIGYFSGSGPTPPYDTPFGKHLNIKIDLTR